MESTQKGFTLVEMITVVSIVGILLAIGVPSFKYVTTANRMSSEINGLLGDLQYARAEAIKRGLPVSVCASNDGLQCANSGLQAGWIVFSDSGTAGTVDGQDVVLRVQRPITSGDAFSLNPPGIAYIQFNREGVAVALPIFVVTLHDVTANPSYTRCLSLTIVGAATTHISGATMPGGGTCQ